MPFSTTGLTLFYNYARFGGEQEGSKMVILDSQRKLLIEILNEDETNKYQRICARRGNEKTEHKRELVLHVRQSLFHNDNELTEMDKVIIVEALYDRLCADILLDTRGELPQERRQTLFELQVIAAQLFHNMEMRMVQPNLFHITEDIEFSHAEFVRMGLYDLVPTDKITSYTEGRGELSKIAKHVLRVNSGKGPVYTH